jgi:hypothetical protein
MKIIAALLGLGLLAATVLPADAGSNCTYTRDWSGKVTGWTCN